MKCKRCGIAQATVTIAELREGVRRETNLCEACARRMPTLLPLVGEDPKVVRRGKRDPRDSTTASQVSVAVIVLSMLSALGGFLFLMWTGGRLTLQEITHDPALYLPWLLPVGLAPFVVGALVSRERLPHQRWRAVLGCYVLALVMNAAPFALVILGWAVSAVRNVIGP